MVHDDAAGSSGPISRCLASGQGWSLTELVCHAGPGDRAFEECHEGVSIAAVIAGSFTYASDRGRALLHPGALLLGNHGACYCCGHEHSAGDHCLSVQFSPEAFAEIAATAAGWSKFRFSAAMLPARREMLPHTALLEARCSAGDVLHMEERLIGFAAAVLRTLSGVSAEAARISAQDERRIGRALRHLEQHSDETVDLDGLAGVAAMSKFHFLRVFRRSAGMTPYQYLLGLRLRRAAMRLLNSQDNVAKIAFESGFGDLSTFTTTFRHCFGMSPTAFRRSGSLA